MEALTPLADRAKPLSIALFELIFANARHDNYRAHPLALALPLTLALALYSGIILAIVSV